MNRIANFFKEIKQYPSAIVGLTLIFFLIIFSIYAVIKIPYPKAIALWKGSDDVWIENPINASPAWVNYFPGVNKPKTITVDSAQIPNAKTITPLSTDMNMVDLEMSFNYSYDGFPKEINILFTSNYEDIGPHVDMFWVTPDGREIALDELALARKNTYRISQSSKIKRRLNNIDPHIGLLLAPGSEPREALKGEYKLRIEGFTFEEASDFDAKLVLYGQVHGIAGTDHKRRDLSVALLWGAPIGLAFSLGAALSVTFFNLIFAAIGVWYGGWIDSLIQRLTEIYMVLPTLPIYVMVALFLSRSIWVILLTIIVMSLFRGTKIYRAMFLQIKESHYIEAAKAYGAGNFRIIFRYLIPRIIPTLIPSFVTAIPDYVFLEASLAFLGVGDPILPTWGKIIDDARVKGALHMGQYYWILEPAFFLIITGFAFALLGFALDRIFNPRLRGL